MEEWMPLALQLAGTVVALASAVVAGGFANRAAKTATTTGARRELLAEKQRVYAEAFEALVKNQSLLRLKREDPSRHLLLIDEHSAVSADGLRLLTQLVFLGDEAVSDYVSNLQVERGEGATWDQLNGLSELMRADIRNARQELGITKRKPRV